MGSSDDIRAFIARWQGTTASELATSQSFVMDLCELLSVPKPHATPAQDYMFERPSNFTHGDDSTSPGRVDCYRRGHFVLEAKKLQQGSHTKGFDVGLQKARSQAEDYARALPAEEGRPPFLLVVDVGTVLEVYAEFSRSGATYTPFPDPRSHRIALADLAQPGLLERLRLILTNPDALNPALISAKVTRGVSQQLATLARSLELGGNSPHDVAAYLSRCIFSMFAEDAELLPKGAFHDLLKRHRQDPMALQQMLRFLWADMDKGGFPAALVKPVLQFNGKLFKGSGQPAYSLLLNAEQIDGLIEAAGTNWRDVEPAIFGTLLERALDPNERHALGAHYTPRAYVERLVMPTVIEPLRLEWATAQAAALTLAQEASELEASPPPVKTKKDFAALDRHNAAVRAKWKEARQQVSGFLHRLCTLRWLRPAFQNNQGVQTALAAEDSATDGAEAEADDTAANPPPAAITQRPWPAGLPDQIKAVADVLSQARRSLDLEELASHFSGRGRWRERLPTLLDTLLALGLLRQTGQGRWVNARR